MPADPVPPSPPKPDPAATSDRVGRHLRHIYDDMLLDPVPDEFLDLLKKLK